MKRLLICILIFLPLLAWAQEERKYIREGYKAYMNEDFNEAEIGFRKAEEVNSESYIAKYNTSAALYQQQNLEESGKRFTDLLAEAPNEMEQAKLLHNLGNVLVEGEKYQEAADAYKRSLRLNPDDEDTRYNLAYALEKLRELEQQQQQDQQQNNEQNQDQEKKDNQQENQENQEEQQQQQQQAQEENANEEEQQQQQPQKQELSKEEAERLLDAILQKEKDVKEEVDKKKAATAKIKTDKDW